MQAVVWQDDSGAHPQIIDIPDALKERANHARKTLLETIAETDDSLLKRYLDETQTIHGVVPLSEMFGYATALRSITQGRAVFTMEFDHYAPVPEQVKAHFAAKPGQ